MALGIAFDVRRYDPALDGVLTSVPHRELGSEASDSFVGVLLGVINEGPVDGGPLPFTEVAYAAGRARDAAFRPECMTPSRISAASRHPAAGTDVA